MTQDNHNLTPQQIGRIFDGDVDEILLKLLTDNPTLQAELDEIKAFDEHLQQALNTDSAYPTSMEIGEYLLGLLDEAEITHFEKLLLSSPRLQYDLRQLESFMASDADISVEAASTINMDNILWANLIQVPQEERLKVAGDSDEKDIYTFEADGHSLLLELEANHANDKKLIGQFATPEFDKWAGSQVKVHFRDGTALQFHLDEMCTFTKAWSHPGEFALHIVNADGQVFHTGLISI